MNFLTVLLLLFFFGENIVNGFYFKLLEGEKRCFIEEVPENTVITGKYKISENFHEKNKKFKSENVETMLGFVITDPKGTVITDRDYKGKTNSFTFVSQTSGEYTVCLNIPKSNWRAQRIFNVAFEILIAEEAMDYEVVVNENKLFDDLQLKLHKLDSTLMQILSEQEYQKKREAQFRNTSLNLNKSMFFWSIFQIVIIAACGYFQIRHYKKFFEEKKLI